VPETFLEASLLARIGPERVLGLAHSGFDYGKLLLKRAQNV
jgi:hypothetical protein